MHSCYATCSYEHISFWKHHHWWISERLLDRSEIIFTFFPNEYTIRFRTLIRSGKDQGSYGANQRRMWMQVVFKEILSIYAPVRVPDNVTEPCKKGDCTFSCLSLCLSGIHKTFISWCVVVSRSGRCVVYSPVVVFRSSEVSGTF